MMYGSWDMEYNRQNSCHFGSFLPFQPTNKLKNQNFEKMKKTLRYHHFTLVYNKWQSYDVQLLRYGARQIEFFVIFLKKRKKPEDIIISHLCNTNDNHMMYCFWDMEEDRHNFLSFWTIFCHFTPLTQEIQKIKILKKWKKHLEISFYDINENHMINGSWDMMHDRQNFLSVWATFCPFTPPTSEKIKIMKK